jgi:hypothetical protein
MRDGLNHGDRLITLWFQNELLPCCEIEFVFPVAHRLGRHPPRTGCGQRPFPVSNLEAAGFAGEAFDMNPKRLARFALGAHEKSSLGAELVKLRVRPCVRHGGKHADLPTPTLQEQIHNGRRSAQGRFNHGIFSTALDVKGVGQQGADPDVAGEELLQQSVGFVAHPQRGIKRCAAGERIARERLAIAV